MGSRARLLIERRGTSGTALIVVLASEIEQCGLTVASYRIHHSTHSIDDHLGVALGHFVPTASCLDVH